MDFARSFASSSRNGPPNLSNLGINFQLPRFDLNSLVETFNSRSFAPNFMSASAANETERDMECENCGARFTLLKRKKTCSDCTMYFCSACFAKECNSSDRTRCYRCRVLSKHPLDRNALMKLRVRDLVWFLAKKHVSVEYCKEKSELVDLIMQNSCPANSRRSYSEASSPVDENPLRQSSYQSPTNAQQHNFGGSDDSQVRYPPNLSRHLNEEQNSRLRAHSLSNLNASAEKSDDLSKSGSSSDLFKPFNIEDLSDPAEIENLSIRQLKLLLTRNFVDYRGCCEKEEILKKAVLLWHEKQKNKQCDADDIPDANICKICMEAQCDCVLLECGHMVTCTECGKRLSECPICRQYVVRAVHIFKA